MSTKKSSGHKCSYKNCGNNSNKTTISFFCFPVNDKERCRRWIVNSGREDFADLPESRLRCRTLCANHFKQSAFMNHLRKRLLRDHPAAVPVPWFQPDVAEDNVPATGAPCTCHLDEPQTSGSNIRNPYSEETLEELVADFQPSTESTFFQETEEHVSDESDETLPKKKKIAKKSLQPDNVEESTSTNDGTENVSDQTAVFTEPEALLSDQTAVFIKQEALEPDVEMADGTTEENDPFEAVDVEPNIDQHNNEDLMREANIKVEHLNDPEEETMKHEILPESIKAEPLDIIDEHTVTSEKCPECDEEVWDLERHIDEQHSKTEGTQLLPTITPKQYPSKIRKLSQPPSQTVSSKKLLKVPMATSVTNIASTIASSSSISTQVKATAQRVPSLVSSSKSSTVDKVKNPKSKQYVVLVPKTAVNKQSVILPVAGTSSTVSLSPPPPPPPSTSLPSCTVDSSETFSISLARFPESQRISIKKKMLEVVEAVERLKINPEMIVIAHKAEVP